MASQGNVGDSIASRTSKLNQMFQGRKLNSDLKSVVSREGLLDALFVLYDECSSEYLMKNEYIADFVKKYASTIGDLKSLRISLSDFEVKNIIGRGHFGEVQVVRERYTGDVYALKVLRKADTLAQQNVAFYEEERDIMAKAQNTWITQLQYAFQDKQHLYLVMEFHPGGDLLSLLARYDDVFEEAMAKFYLAEMVLAVRALHTMGYVHRDVKPENVLIDRTGHIKLADFGSACKLSDANSGKIVHVTVSNMPVGTPDYICPEVLQKMNSSDNRGKFGEECDWWSLGICAYEMLFGKTPFTDEKGSMVVTYANIMSFKKCLKFPSETEVSSDAMHLIKCLLTDSDRRLKYEGICIHRFFSDTDFDNIRQTTPPFIPTITSKDDTSNFDEFEKLHPAPSLDQYKRKTEFSGKDLPFIGFTFTKSLVSERPSLSSNLTSEVSSPAAKNSLERRLQTKTKELQDTREKCTDLENRNVGLAADKERLKVHVKEKESQLRVVQNERDCLERDVAHYISEIKSLKRLLEVEKEERNNMDSKAMVLLEEITKQNEHAQKLRDETNREELETCHEIIAQLEEERKSLNKKIDRLEREIKDEKHTSNRANSKVTELQARYSQLQRNIKMSAEECTSEMKSREREYEVRENELQDKLDRAYQQTHEATEMLKKTREDKMRLEEELMTIKRKSGVQEALRQRLSDSEEKRKSLETHIHRLEIMERREEDLKGQVTEKSHHITQLAERIAELEETLQSSDLEKKKSEKLAKKREQQLKDRINELIDNMEMLANEKSNLQDQSLMAFEEHEEKLHKIQQQESTIAQLKGNIARLENQIKAMKTDLERQRSPSPRRKVDRRSGWAQTDFSPEKVVSSKLKSAGWTQTDFRKSRSPVKDMDWMSVWEKTNNLNIPHEYPYVYKLTGDKKVKARRSKSLDKVATWVQAQNQARSVVDRRSNQTQTEQVSRKSNQMQTEVHSHTRIPEEVVVSVKFHGDKSDNRRSSNGTSKYADSPETGYKSDSPQSSMMENNSSTILAGHGDGPFTSHATVSLAECTFPLSTRAMKGDDSETEVFSSTVDTDSEQNITVLRHVTNCDAEVQTSNDKERKKRTFRRRESEEISDLKQQKLYLEARVASLEREIQEIRDGTHQQRIRALDLKHELREKTTLYEAQLSELREKLCKTELQLSDAQETANNLKEKDSTLKDKVEKLQRELDVTKMDTRRNVTSLQLWKRQRLSKVQEESKDDLEAQLKMFKERCAKLENVEQEVRTLRVESKQLAPKNKDLESQLRMALDDKSRFKMEADRFRDELNEKRRQCDTLEQRVRQLKSLCEELDSQIQDYEEMNRQYESKESQWKQDRCTYEKAVEEREDESNDSRRMLQKERENRQKAEERVAELNAALGSTQKAYQNEINALKKKTKEQREKIEVLNNQLTMIEKKCSLLELDEKNGNRKLMALNEENIKLKEETSKLITQTTDLKNSNLKLSKQLEEAMDRFEMQANHKSDLENRLETDQANYRHELYKLETHVGQQTKLIMHLQDKVENPPKKKKGLFGSTTTATTATLSRRPEGVPGIQYRELQHSLEHERDKNSTLRQEILRLRDELHVSKAEAMRNLSRSSNNTPESSLLSSASYNTAHSMSFATAQNVHSQVTLSPATQHQRHHRHHHEFLSVDDVDGKMRSMGTIKPQQERMHHNIPHRFITGLNSRPTKCAVCLGSVHFVKPAAKCQECNVVCHPKCSASLPATCGLPTEYAKHFAGMLKQAKKVSTTRISVADLKLQLEGWMKTPRPGKSLWDKKWVVLGNNHVYIYSSENTEDDPVEEFDLRPANGFVTIHSAVTAAELTNTASTDLPYIMRLEFEPETTCWPGRSLYLMALNFSDKQKWVATLEAIITHSPDTFKRKDAKLLGNTILATSDEKRLEINCTMYLSEKCILLGADEGLYLLDLTTATRPPVKVTGVGGIYQMNLLDGTDTVAVITGLKARPKDETKRGNWYRHLNITSCKERQVAVVDISHLRHANSYSTPSVSPRNVEQAYACTCFSLGVIGDGLFMCAALADKILILKWNPNLGNFSSRKELNTSQACSCMYFGKKHIIVGTDRFYKIDLYSYKMSEFLDKHDNTLAFAAFGAAYYDSFPIAVLQLAPPEDHEEFLLCYHEFGVFVDSYGRRSREDDMKWGGLPLGFAYRAPYLYITHFNTLQVVHINSSHKDSVYGNKTFLTLPSPRYLGPALSDQAVYIGSSHDRTAEILVFKGNMVTLDDVDGMKSSVETYRTCTDKENNEPYYARITKKKSSSSLKKATRRSPPKPQNKSTPLKTRNRMRHDDTSDSDSDMSLTDEALYSTPIEAKIQVRRYVNKHAYESTTDQDTSF